MTIAVASGKGGTGKTTVALSLALSSPVPVTLLDCDVEEPNAALFLPLAEVRESPVAVSVPVLDETKCTACGACAQFCEFNAIVRIGTTVMIFPELCHSCGGCFRVCPHGAIREEPSPIGSLTEARVNRESLSGDSAVPITLVQGLLSIGHAMSPPVIRAVKRRGAGLSALTIIDAPPGTSCPMTTAVSGVDAVILVTEPTPFGLHDLDLAVKTLRKMGIPFDVVINRSDSGDARVAEYCEREGIRVLLSIPEDRRIAVGYSVGKPLTESAPEWKPAFAGVIADLQERL